MYTKKILYTKRDYIKRCTQNRPSLNLEKKNSENLKKARMAGTEVTKGVGRGEFFKF